MSKNLNDTKWFSYTSSTETMRTWTRCLKSVDEIPEEFRPAFPDYKDHFPFTLYMPEDKISLFHKRNKKIISLFEDHFVLLEMQNNEIQTVTNKFSDLLYLEHGKVLLHSWLNIFTLSGTVFIRFNTTNNYLFEPIIKKIRQGMSGFSYPRNAAIVQDEQELSKFDHLSSINFKYMNYGKKSIRPHHSVIDMVYQPERSIQEFKLFNKTLFRRYFTDHLSILTDDELILIKEQKRIKIDKEELYGGVFSYIPRHQIQDISFTANQNNAQCLMEITLPENTRLTSEFSLANVELKRLQEYLVSV